MMSKVVELKDVLFSYEGHPVLENINLDILPRDFLGIMGPNGGGKTTLLKLILGLILPHRGEVFVFGSNPRKVTQKIGYVPQYTSIDPTFPITVMDVVLMGLLSATHKGVSFSKEEKQKAYHAMSVTGVVDFVHRRFGTLSLGQRQRVLISRAIVSNPSLLLLDEPTASVDNTLEGDIYSLLQEINRQVTIVLVSHDLGVISTCVNRVACVNRYLVVHPALEMDQDKMAEVYRSPVRILKHECKL